MNATNLFPVLKTLVAPTFPEPTFRIVVEYFLEGHACSVCAEGEAQVGPSLVDDSHQSAARAAQDDRVDDRQEVDLQTAPFLVLLASSAGATALAPSAALCGS